MVSHNRFLLNAVCDHIISINRSSVDVMSGNYDSWKDSFDKREQFERNKNDKLKKDIKQLENASRRASAWSDKTEKSKMGSGSVDRGYIGHKAAKLMKKSKTYEKRIENKIRDKSSLLLNSENDFDLKLSPELYRTQLLGYVHNLCFSVQDKEILKDVTFEIQRGDRIAIKGANGSGKSTLLRILLHELQQTSGAFKINGDVKISYVPQSAEKLSGTLLDYAAENNIDYNLFLSVLNYLDFDYKLHSVALACLSEGQKRKVMLAKSLCEKAHLYIWDEPLNYIDIISRTQLEDMILQYKPTMIFVEHDEMFERNTATKTIYL